MHITSTLKGRPILRTIRLANSKLNLCGKHQGRFNFNTSSRSQLSLVVFSMDNVSSDGKKGILVYGATGHTGKLIAALLKDENLPVTLSGRSETKLKKVSEENGNLPFVAVDLKDVKKLNDLVSKHKVVLHVAGPFSESGPPMVEACLKSEVHYLDITGETQYITWVQSLDEEAKKRGIMMMPAVGYDVVPGECLGAYLSTKLPDASNLDISAFVIDNSGVQGSDASKKSGAFPSHGTILSALLYIIPGGGLAKIGGKLQAEIIGKRQKIFSMLPEKPKVKAFSFPAAELVCLNHSVSVPNISLYFPGPTPFPLQILGYLGPKIVQFGPIKKFIEFLVHTFVPIPKESAKSQVRMWATGEISDSSSGQSFRAAIRTGPGYTFTASSSVEIAKRVLNGQFKTGFQTPVSVYGPNVAREIPGQTVEIFDLE